MRIQTQADAQRKAETRAAGAFFGMLIATVRIACLATVAYLGGWPAFFAGCLLFVGPATLFRATPATQPDDSDATIHGLFLWFTLVMALDAALWVAFIAYLWATP